MRRGGTRGIHLERFVQALEDPSTGLTYSALSGVRKQSVEDVECLFGPGVISFMKRNHYDDQAKYLEVVRNWRSVDECGLSEDQRRQFRDVHVFINVYTHLYLPTLSLPLSLRRKHPTPIYMYMYKVHLHMFSTTT